MSLYTGATAEAKLRAKNMADMFNYKINYFRDTDQKEIF
jgi:hemoglobin